MTINTGLDRLLGNVTVSVTVELGRTEMRLRDVLALGPDSVVPLDRLTDELLDVLVNGKPIAKAEVAAQDGRFALRIVALLRDEDILEADAGAEAA
jgi:flagellar motor switch protein FliN/FliY